MATLPHHDVPRRGTKIYLAPRDQVPARAKPRAAMSDAQPSRIQRMTFIFGASTMLWLGIAALVAL